MNIVRKISLSSLLLFLFFIPFGMPWTNIFLFLSAICLFMCKELYKSFVIRKISNGEKWFCICSLSYIIWCFISLLWSENEERGFILFGRYVPIILLPLFFSLLNICKIIKRKVLLTWSFLIGILVSSFMCIFLSYQNCWHITTEGKVFNFDQENRSIPFWNTILLGTNNFTYVNLSHFIHPAYYTLYILFGILCLLDMYSNSDKSYKRIIIIIVGYFVVFAFLLETRSGLISLFCVAFMWLICNCIIKKQYGYLIIGLFLLSFVGLMVFPHTRLAGMITGVEKALCRSDGQAHDTSESIGVENLRILIWKNAFCAISEQPILGAGIGDTDAVLYERMKADNLDLDLGTHNQYIYAQLSMGVIGLLLLLAMFFPAFYFGVKNRYFPLIGFAVAVMVNLMFENMLTRNAGLMFIPWAMTLLLMMSEEKKKLLEK